MAHAYPPHHNGGAELTLQVLLEHLALRGHHVEVLLNRHPGESAEWLPTSNASAGSGVDYYINDVAVHLPESQSDPFRWFGTSVQPDLVISHLENTTRANVLCDMFGVPHAHLLHNTHGYAKHCLRRGRSDLAIFNTEWMAQDYATWFSNWGLDLPPTITMHPAVHAKDYAVEPNGHQAITLINLFEPKGGSLFWELARRLPKRKFLGVTGAYGEQVDEGPLPNVDIWPHLAPGYMPDVYASTKVLLMPSEYESYGRTAVEASCSGIPVIAHPTPGLREALGPDGIFCDREDPDAWIAALRRLQTPKGYAKSRANAFAVAQAQRPLEDLDRIADALEGVGHGHLAATG